MSERIAEQKIQIYMMTSSYEGLLKDKAVISAEVMHEYGEKVRPKLLSV